MTLIYLVVSVILSGAVWVCTQLDWEYAYILTYFFLFMASWYICLVFVYQEEYDRTKKFTFFTPAHLLFLAIDIGLLIYFWKWKLADFQTVRYAKYKAVILMNLIQGSFLMIYFKLRDFYIHL